MEENKRKAGIKDATYRDLWRGGDNFAGMNYRKSSYTRKQESHEIKN